LKDVLFRFIVGGLVVSAFSALGDVLKPKSWTGMGCSGRCRSVMANDFDFDLENAEAVTRPSFPFEIGLSLIADDSETMRRVVRTILRSRHWTICGEAENGRTGVENFQKLKPNVVVLDLSMPDMTGIETAQQMSAADPSVPLILFTILGD
jgi:PleD family two-component response regulator